MDEPKLWQRIVRHKAMIPIVAFGYVDMICSSATGVNGVLINSVIDFIFK